MEPPGGGWDEEGCIEVMCDGPTALGRGEEESGAEQVTRDVVGQDLADRAGHFTLLQVPLLPRRTSHVTPFTHVFLQAWIRMAINDGVLESYMNAMLGEPRTLRTFYSRTAYLRDPEHPGISRTYIQGESSGVPQGNTPQKHVAGVRFATFS